MIQPNIVFENDELAVINKPSGWIVNEASTTKGQPVVQTWIYENIKSDISKNKELRNGIVHRLDKETSGVLVIAKTKGSFNNLQKQFKDRKIKKQYAALVHGIVDPKEGKIKVPVGRLSWRRDRFGVVVGGRDSETHYKAESFYKREKEDYSLLSLTPITGRTHQIRIHMKYLGYPIVSDQFYAGRKVSRNDRKWCERLFLHASQISFNIPKSKKDKTVKAPLPKDLSKALSSLEKLHENG